MKNPWVLLWKRFHDFVVSSLPKREPFIATDASGLSDRKRSWCETDHGLKATQDRVMIHADNRSGLVLRTQLLLDRFELP
jgi:hypothetical protein